VGALSDQGLADLRKNDSRYLSDDHEVSMHMTSVFYTRYSPTLQAQDEDNQGYNKSNTSIS